MECSKLFPTLIALLGALVLTNAIVCLPNYCETDNCVSPTECPEGSLLRSNTSFCGCCATCIKQIPSGGLCPLVFFGSPRTAECSCGRACVTVNGTSVCP